MLSEAAALAEFPAFLAELIESRRIKAGDRDDSDVGEPTGFDILAALAGVLEGARQATIFRAACSFRGTNVTKKVTLQACLDAARKCSPVFAETEVRKIVDRVWKTYAAGGQPKLPPTGDRPAIDTSNHDLVEAARRSWAAIELANNPPRYFRFLDAPSRIKQSDDGSLLPIRLDRDRLRHELARAADFGHWKKSADGWIWEKDAPPLIVVEDMLAGPAAPLPPLTQIMRVPFFARGGELVVENGYHAPSRTYLSFHERLAAVPAVPTAQDLGAAKDLIIVKLLGDFRFSSEADRAHAIALGLLPLVRGRIEGSTPLHLLEAPLRGTGKTLLWRSLLAITLGGAINLLGEIRAGDELRKTITGCALAGASAIFFDNQCRPVTSPELSRAITANAQSPWTERVMKENRTVSSPLSVIWGMSGNNPVLSDEIARRTIRIRLDPQCEHPEERTDFRHRDIVGWTIQNRCELLRAFLLLVQHWIAAGCPASSASPLGSFENWSKVLGGILLTAGIPGFLANRLEAAAIAHDETAAWQEFFSRWWAAHGGEVTVKDLFPLAKETDGIRFGRSDIEHAQRITFGSGIKSRRDRVFSIKHGQAEMAVTLRAVLGRDHHARCWKLVPRAAAESDSARANGGAGQSINGYRNARNESLGFDQKVESIEI